jgi:hexosaminidase
MARSLVYSAILCALIIAAPVSGYSAAHSTLGTAAVTLHVFTQSDTVRAYAASIRNRNNALIDSAVATGYQIQFLHVATSVLTSPSSQAPAGFWLEQNYPNPFNPSTRIRFQIAAPGTVTLQIFDVLGKTVGSYTGELQAGIHEFNWESGVAAGVYFYRINAGTYAETKKMIKVDGGGFGTSMLREISSGAANGTSAEMNQNDAHRSNETLKKIEASDYSITIYDLLQTDPQVIDTVIHLSVFTQDTVLNISAAAAQRSIVIPMPDSMRMTDGSFVLSAATKITVDQASTELTAIGQYLADKVRPATGFSLSVVPAAGAPAPGTIRLTTAGTDSLLGDEGYTLTITQNAVTLAAYKPAGLFHGVQTIRQLLPPAIEDSIVHSVAWKLQTGTIEDHPRFAWRGAMQDVARHFFGVSDLKHLIDFYSYYKMNHLHLHLADDTWSIEIKSWPDLAPKGRSPGAISSYGYSYLTQAQYSDLCAYAQSRYMTIGPEIDLPGHFAGALAAYPQLNYGTSYWTNPMFYTLLDDVFRELSAITPGPYIHIGGDEAYQIPQRDYNVVTDSVQKLVHKYGKYVDGWEEISAGGHLPPHSIVQHWNYPIDTGSTPYAIRQGAKTLISRANKLYLDQKYTKSTVLGLSWAGYIEVQDAYNWDPAQMLPSIKENDIEGVESPLWSETTVTLSDIEYLAFPRVIGHAEIGWSLMTGRNWDEYKVRLGYHGRRLAAMGINFYRSPQVPWK